MSNSIASTIVQLQDAIRALHASLAQFDDMPEVQQILRKRMLLKVKQLMALQQAQKERSVGGGVSTSTASPDKASAAASNEPAAAYSPELGAYLRTLSSLCNRLSLADIDSSDPTRAAVELAAIYTRLEVADTSSLEDTLTWNLRRLSALEVLAAYPRLVLLGEPGSGKSTFVNFVGLCLSQILLQQPEWDRRLRAEWPHGALIPVRVELRDFAAWISTRPTRPARGDALLFWAWLLQTNTPELMQLLRQEAAAGNVLFLFDGLDEVPANEQAQPVSIVVETITALAASASASRILVTCRLLDYEQAHRQIESWPKERLIPFSPELRNEFITRWYDVMAQLGRALSADHTLLRDNLQREVQHRPELRRLAGNPLLLTMMTLLHAYEGRLPDERVKLYARCVELLLHRWRPVRSEPPLHEQLHLPSWSADDLHRLLDRLGWVAHERSASVDDEEGVDLPRTVLLEIAQDFFAPYDMSHAVARAQTFCAYISRHSNGVIQQFGPNTYRFPHRTFQVYLAARRLIADEDWGNGDVDFVARALHHIAAGQHWREVVLLAVSQQVVIGNQSNPVASLVEELLMRDWDDTVPWAQHVVLAGEVLAEIGRERLTRLGPRRSRLWTETISALTRLLRCRPDGALILDPAGRIQAGAVLGLLGDPRPGVCSREPDWCSIPAGPFVIGSNEADNDAFGDEKPQTTLDLPTFRIARYPVTNAQWKLFLDDGGYQTSHWWSEAGWRLASREAWSAPRLWDDPRFNGSNQPVVGITWYEAMAYCAWLSAQLGYTVRLPERAEWEKAARGTNGFLYPWGNVWDRNRAYVERKDGAPTPVGCYPDGASPYGVLDMSGNVLEWTATPWTDSYAPSDEYFFIGADAETAMENPVEDEDDKRYVVRGGAWNLTHRSARCAYQLWRRLLSWGDNLGLRLLTED